jgi:hypothetical protein
MPAPINLFLTGCYRSGTTLLEKLLHAHENVCLAPQPFPLLYFHAKSAFHEAIGIERRYPLNHLFLEDSYQPEDFHAFLDQFEMSKERLDNMFNELAKYSGLHTREILEFHDRIVPGTFINVYRQLNGIIGGIFPKDNILMLGGKEILCEEYVPYLLSKSSKAIIIIRDPRDMITSLNFRKRLSLAGVNRPLLFSLRIWRKSVAIALAHETSENLLWLRYEDLVNNPFSVLGRVTSFLGLEAFSEGAFNGGVPDQHGILWKGNSSFDDMSGISSSSVDKYVEVLPTGVTAYIEACCWPEMKVLGYNFFCEPHFDKGAVLSYKEPFQIEHERFTPDYSYRSDHIEEEIERYRRLEEGRKDHDAEDAKLWFLYEAVYYKLRSAVIR